MCMSAFGQCFFLKTYLIEQYTNFFYLYIFVLILSSCCMDVIISGLNWLINLSYLINWFQSTFGPFLGHHQDVYILQKR